MHTHTYLGNLNQGKSNDTLGVRRDYYTKKLKEVAKEVTYTKDRLITAYKMHESCDWDWTTYLAKYDSSPRADWLLYSNAIYSELRTIFKHNEDVSDFLKTNKELCAVLGNWALNIHLSQYRKCITVVESSILFTTESSNALRLIYEIYIMLRKAGCTTVPRGLSFPTEGEERPSVQEFTKLWKKCYGIGVIKLDSIDDKELGEWKKFIAKSHKSLFNGRSPLILSADDSSREMLGCFMEYRL